MSDNQITIEITKKCPNACIHCSSESTRAEDIQLSRASILTILQKAAEKSISKVIISGGEPFCHPELPDIIDDAYKLKLPVVLYTSGVTLNPTKGQIVVPEESLIKRISKKLHRINLSIHSFEAKLNDEFMNKAGALDSAIKFLGLALKCNITTEIHCVVTSKNVSSVIDLAKNINRKFPKVKKLRLLHLVNQGRALNTYDSLKLSDAEYTHLHDQVNSWNSDNKIKTLKIVTGAHFNFNSNTNIGGYSCQCSVNKMKTFVTPDDRLIMCPALKTISRIINSEPVAATKFYDPSTSPDEYEATLIDLEHEIRPDPKYSICYASMFNNAGLEINDYHLFIAVNNHINSIFITNGETEIRPQIKIVYEEFKNIYGMLASKAKDQGVSFNLFKFRQELDDKSKPFIRLWKNLIMLALWKLTSYDKRQTMPHVEVPEISDLEKYYDSFEAFEPFLYSSNSRYRDHLVHVFKVWLLGTFLIFEKPFDKNFSIRRPTVSKDIGNDVNKNCFCDEELYACFTLSALTHDLGYPLEQIDAMSNQAKAIFKQVGGLAITDLSYNMSAAFNRNVEYLVKYISSAPIVSPNSGFKTAEQIQSAVQGAVNENNKAANYLKFVEAEQKTLLRFSFRSQAKYYQKYSASAEKNSHGLMSALILMKKLRYFREGEYSTDTAVDFTLEEIRQFLLRRDVLRAVTSHTCNDIYFLHPYDLGCFLFICDELQDWGRPRISELLGKTPDEQNRLQIKDFSSNRIWFKITSNSENMDNMLASFIYTSTMLYTRFRDGPETAARNLLVQFDIEWGNDRKKAFFRIAPPRLSKSLKQKVTMSTMMGRSIMHHPNIVSGILHGKNQDALITELCKTLK